MRYFPQIRSKLLFEIIIEILNGYKIPFIEGSEKIVNCCNLLITKNRSLNASNCSLTKNDHQLFLWWFVDRLVSMFRIFDDIVTHLTERNGENVEEETLSNWLI